MSRILLILLCFYTIQVEAQRIGEVQHFLAGDGYPMSEVGEILQCKDGYLWLGAREGLFRYDGYDFAKIEFHPPNLQVAKSDVVRALHYDSSRHCLFIGTIDDGIFQYSLLTNAARYLPLSTDLSKNMSTQSKKEFYQPTPDLLWVATLDGLLSLNLENNEFSLYQRVTDRNDAFVDPWSNRMDDLLVTGKQDQYWLASHRGLYEFNASNESFEIVPGLLAENNFPYHITDLFKAENDKLYFGTWVQGLFELDPKTLEMQNFNLKEAFGKNLDFVTIHHLDVGRPGELLLATSVGVISFDIEARSFQLLAGLQSNKVSRKIDCAKTLIDQQSILWIGHSDGLTRMNLEPGIVQHINLQSLSEFADHKVNITAQMDFVDETILIGTDGGLWTYDIETTQFDHPYELEKVIGKEIWEFIPDSDSTNLIVSQNGLFRIWKHNGTIHQICNAREVQEFQFRLLLSSTLDSRNNIWYGLQWGRGICRLNLNTKEWRYFPQSEFFADSLLSSGGFESIIADQEDRIWISTNRGLLTFDQNTEKFSLHQSKPGSIAGIQDPTILGITIDKTGQIWINSGGKGLHRIDPNQPIDRVLPYYPASQFGINLFGYLTTDPNGNIWATTTSGVLKFNPESLTYQILNRSDGFPTNLLAPWGIHPLNDSTMCVGTYDGFNIWSADLTQKNVKPAKVILTGAKVFDKDIDTDTTPNHLQQIRLTHKQNFFSFTFAAMDFKDPSKNVYRYKLDGFDPNWIDSGTRHYANYTNVPPGDYTFIVECANGDGVWSDQPKSIDVKVIAPYWQRGWFYLFCAFVLAIIIYFVNRYQVSQIRKEERIKTEFNKKLSEVEMEVLRSQMNPHFLFNALNSIKHFILANDKFVAAEYLTNFSRLVRQILNNSKSKSISLEQELETLRLYIEMEKMRFEEKFTYDITVDENVDTFSKMIPPLILQPYVENAIWHGLMHKKDPGHLSIQIKEKDGRLICIIDDDGIGREKAFEIKSKSATKGKSYGMQITKSRIDHTAEHTEVQIIDKSTKTHGSSGTRVEISLQQNSIK